MRKIETTIEINATPEKVWQVLLDFEHYPQWNPFIKTISGKKEIDAQLTVEIQPPENKTMVFKPIVLDVVENKEFRWKGKLFFKGLFDGEHFFKLSQTKEGTTLFTQGENFSGILVAILARMLVDTETGFELMNHALKEECENSN